MRETGSRMRSKKKEKEALRQSKKKARRFVMKDSGTSRRNSTTSRNLVSRMIMKDNSRNSYLSTANWSSRSTQRWHFGRLRKTLTLKKSLDRGVKNASKKLSSKRSCSMNNLIKTLRINVYDSVMRSTKFKPCWSQCKTRKSVWRWLQETFKSLMLSGTMRSQLKTSRCKLVLTKNWLSSHKKVPVIIRASTESWPNSTRKTQRRSMRLNSSESRWKSRLPNVVIMRMKSRGISIN